MADTRRYTHPPTLEDFAVIAETALGDIPADLSSLIEGVALRVDDFPDEDTVREMELETPFDLLGLYSGVPFGEKTLALGGQPDMIFLYRRPILDYWCDSGEDLTHVIKHVLIHEIGHHYGLSDADMEELESQAGH